MKIYLVKYLKDGFADAIEGAYHVLAEDPVDAIKRTQNEWPVKGKTIRRGNSHEKDDGEV